MQTNNINQVLLGALNQTNNSHSIGNIDGLNFVACAVGKTLVILDENFQQIQTIQSDFNSQIQIVSSCNESGKIAICCDKMVQIYEPISQNNNEQQQSPYNWIRTQKFDMDYQQIDYIHWLLDGFRLLIFANKFITLYQHKLISCAIVSNRPTAENSEVKFTLNPAEDECIWEVIWQTKLANQIKYVQVSHDGTLFATCGEKEPLVKIWYQLKDSQSFSFIYIQHPAPVCGFEWRNSAAGGHLLMSRRFVHNALITWCEDNTARIWKEIPSNEPAPELQFINAVQNAIALHHEKENDSSKQPTKKNLHSHRLGYQMRRTKNRLVYKLAQMMNEKKKVSIVETLPAGTTTNEMCRSSTFADFSIPAYTPSDTLVFCLAATINAENDCFLVPSMSNSQIDNDVKIKNSRRIQTRPFTVHWLNNKEYEFEIGTQRILAETIFEKSDFSRDISPCQMMHSLHSSTSSAGLVSDLNVPSSTQQLPHPTTAPNLLAKTTAGGGHQTLTEQVENTPLAKDLIDYKLEKLLRNWSKSCDILFTIHPIDGSLLTWTLEWLDDPWKQPTISFSSRIPEAFPLVDTISLLPGVKTLRPSYTNLLQQWQQQQQTNTNKIAADNSENMKNLEIQHCITCDKFMAENNNEIYLLTEHQNGFLNLWRLQMDSSLCANEQHVSSNQQRSNISSTMMSSVTNCIHGIRLGKPSNEPTALEILKSEGYFDACSLSNQLLPQYHPMQLVGMLNAGKIQCVRAILLNILRALRFRQPAGSFSQIKPFGRSGTSANKKQKIMNSIDADADSQQHNQQQRRNSISAMSPLDSSDLEYDVLDAVTPLPLYALLAADSSAMNKIADSSEKAKDKNNPIVESNNKVEESNVYESFFSQNYVEDDLELQDDFEQQSYEERKNSLSRSSRKISLGSINEPNFLAINYNSTAPPPTKFTTKHSRILTDMLTHTHLHGLTSVDQMHLLAIADTISQFSNSIVDRLAQANAAFQPVVMSSMGDSSASGYAIAATGMETVDECGLRFLMAKKQHEYLLRCLPLKQRRQLKIKGISTAYVIWAFHSCTETELLNSIPCFQRQQENWDELRSYGIAWWLRNNATLRICIERIAKNAFQKDQAPLDAALFYLAMRKKNVLTQLFKTVNDTRMYEFFREDFTNEKWKKAALKNAFVLMSKQRFHHASAFFLLGGSLKDALQTILHRVHDLQLAIVVLRLYETDPEKQLELLTELLCKEVLGCDTQYIQKLAKEKTANVIFPNSKRDLFERSMSLWIMNEYVLSAETLLHETNIFADSGYEEKITIEKFEHQAPSVPDIFNFYSFLRRHPLVIRQKLSRAGITTTTTEQFLTWTRQIGSEVSENEKQLYLRTANAHLNAGCPYLALNVLCSLPEQFDLEQQQEDEEIKLIQKDANNKQTEQQGEIDWSAPVAQMKEEKLELNWGEDDDDEEEEKKEPQICTEVEKPSKPTTSTSMPAADVQKCPAEFQELKLLSILSIMADELNTLASEDYEVAGGQLRFELFCWLEKECEMLCKMCCNSNDEEAVENEPTFINEEEFVTINDASNEDSANSFNSSSKKEQQQQLPPLHEALQQDRMELRERFRQILRRRNWLKKHQKLLHTLAAYCALNGHRNIRLTAIQMELLLLLLEMQRNEKDELQHVNEPIPDIHSFPLLVSSLSPNVNLPISPLRFIADQCATLLTAINDFEKIPQIDADIPKVTKLFNLCQGLSFCVYQSLSNLENLATTTSTTQFSGPLTQRRRHSSSAAFAATNSSNPEVTSQPNHWPGVSALIALLTRERFLLDEAPPNLRLLLVQIFISIYIAIFYYAMALYDSRLLYRLSAHSVDAKMFGEIFGGAGERRLRSAVPIRPPPPKIDAKPSDQKLLNQDELAAMRAKLHAKVFSAKNPQQKGGQTMSSHGGASDQIIQTWVSPRKHIVQYFMDKVSIEHQATTTSEFYDSDQESISENDDDQANEDGVGYFKFQQNTEYPADEDKKSQIFAHDSPEGYAWTLIRLALLRQIYLKLEYFIELAGFDFREIARNFPKLEQIIRRLNFWATQLEDKLETQPDGCPTAFLPNMHIQNPPELDSWTSLAKIPLMQKYGVLIEHGNTPFEYDEPGVKPVRRLWTQLVHQIELMPIFVRFIFGKNQLKNKSQIGSTIKGGTEASSKCSNILSIIKLIHREHDPIVSFAVNSTHPNQIVLSTGRELQELNIGIALEEKDRVCSRVPHFPSTSSFLFGQNRAELDIHLQGIQRDPLRDNDDYQLILPSMDAANCGRTIPAQTTSNLRKRPISGIRRLESHQRLPYYVSGSSDGSIFLWEWGVEQPIFIARIAGQFAKVVKLSFAQNGSRFAAVDGDGLLCLWHAQTGMPSRKPYFSQKCHNKFAADVKYVGQTTTLLATAGHSTGDQNILLWDTIMPASKAIVHSYVGHQDGAQCLAYQPNSQSIISGGKHGEICIWDVRQRQLRHTFKAFDSTGSSVKCLCLDPNADIIAAGSNEGDIKIWSASTPVPQLLYSLPTEHISRSGFSLRQVASISLQGVQQISIDQRMHMFSCGADNSLKIRIIPSLL